MGIRGLIVVAENLIFLFLDSNQLGKVLINVRCVTSYLVKRGG
jgi:hypothetical protein